MQRTQRDGARTVVTASTSIAVVAVDSVSDGASIVLQEWTSDHDLIMNANFEDYTFAKPLICFHENRCPKCMARSAP